MADVTIPHLAVPFHVTTDGSVAVVPQDTIDEITQCVEAVLLTTAGFRLEMPTFGVPDPLFRERADRQAMLAAVGAWEPRADVLIAAAPDAIDSLIERITVTVSHA